MKKILILFRKVRNALLSEVPYHRWCFLVAGGFFCFLFCVALIIYVLDPCFRYRYPSLTTPLYINARTQIPGMLRNGEYDMVLYGTSMCQNFALDDLKKTFNVKNPLKCTIPGQRTFEMTAFLELTREWNPDIPVICLGFDIFSLQEPEEQDTFYFQKPFTVNECRYLFNFNNWRKYISSSLRWELYRDKRIKPDTDSNMMFAWEIRKRTLWGAEGIRQSLHAAEQRPHDFIRNDEVHTRLQPLISSLKKFPNTRIVIFMPPYSLVYWSLLDANDFLESELQNRKTVLNAFLELPNVEIYDCNTAEDIITQLGHYKDITHYHPKINTEICRKIASGEKRILSPEDVENANKELLRLIGEYKEQYEKEGLRFRY